MRVAQCLECPIQQHGGTEVLVRELVAGLAARHEIVLVSGDTAESWRGSVVAPFVREHLPWRVEGADAAQARDLAETLAARGVELAHFHFGGTYAWGSRRPELAPPFHLRALGVPCVITNHGVFDVLDGYIGAQRSLLTKLALLPFAWANRLRLIARVEAEIAVSGNDYRALRRRFWPARGKFRQIYHSRIHERDPVVKRTRTKTVLCAGTVGARKGQPYLARAFARLAAEFPEWELVFIGRAGDEETTVELKARLAQPELRACARWLPACPDEELQQWLQTAEIFAMPSMHEGLGLSLQEALYHGAACIASRIGGIPDLLQHGDNGILVERANVDELAGRLGWLMRDDAARARLQARAHASVLEKDMTAERMVARYEELYRAVMERRR